MTNTIKCKNCGVEIEVSQALSHQIEEQVLLDLQVKHQKELENARKEAEMDLSKKLAEKFETQLNDLKKEKDEEKERNKGLTKQLTELLDEMRSLKRKDEERDLEMKKKIMEEEEKIKQETAQKIEEEHRLKDLEKDKKLADSLKQVEELRAKMQQGSQQTQGEVLELELEKLLKAEFPLDSVQEVSKGVRGADLKQEVIDRNGTLCGMVLWETKNAQWTDKWIEKLKEDQREVKADLAVLVSINLPANIKHFVYRDGVWITSKDTAIALAYTLRFNLVQANYLRKTQEGKKEKSEALYAYLCSHEFRHRVEAMLTHYSSLQKEMEQEKRWFSLKWARQEKSLRTMIDQTNGFYGELQHLIGSEQLPQLENGYENLIKD